MNREDQWVIFACVSFIARSITMAAAIRMGVNSTGNVMVASELAKDADALMGELEKRDL